MPHFALTSPTRWERIAAVVVLLFACTLLEAPAGAPAIAAGAIAPPREEPQRAGAAAGISFAWVGSGTLAQAKALVNTRPAEPAGYIAWGGAAWRQGDFTAAARALESGRAKASRSAALLVALGSIYAEQGRLREAEKVTREAVKTDPRSADALYQLGVLQDIRHHDEDAVATLQQALAAAPERAAVQCRLVVAMAEAGHASTAEELCRGFLEKWPQRADLWIALGEALEAQEKGQEAFGAYGKALTLDPKSAGAHSRRARLFCRFTQYEAAQFECRAALQLDPQDALAHACLGIACAHLGQKDEARREALRAQQSGMQVEEVWDVIGRP